MRDSQSRRPGILFVLLSVVAAAPCCGQFAAMPFTFIDARPAAIAPRPAVAQADTVSPAWVTVPAGAFEMGCVPGDGQCFPQERPRHTIRISRPFEIMTTEVTLGMYRRLAAPPAQPVWNTDDSQPVVDVTWGEADSYCAAAGGRLPTEAEWEYAARGGRAGERHVWGNGSSPLVSGAAAANVADESVRRRYPLMTIFTGYDDGYAFTAPAGTFAPNASGLFDMAGNVWEWVADRYGANYYAASPQTDPTGPSSGDRRVVRGGSWYSYERDVRISRRGGDEPIKRPYGNGVGFRCVRDVPAERL